MHDKIIKAVGLPGVLCQLTEEAGELVQAAAKLQRVIDGKNPTPVTAGEAMDNLLEEATDVRVCLAVLDDIFPTFDEQMFTEKLNRWEKRIEEANNHD